MAEILHLHTTHHEIVKRLKRAEGHLRAVVEMIEAGRSCLEITQQLHAVEKAIGQAKKTLISDHLDHCLEDVVGALGREKRRSIDEFKEHQIFVSLRCRPLPLAPYRRLTSFFRAN